MTGFQSTPPARGATTYCYGYRYNDIHFNPHPPRGGRQSKAKLVDKSGKISIHTPREGGDRHPRSPDGDGHHGFQSTPPARGATFTEYLCQACRWISIHTPREGGDDDQGLLRYLQKDFNPHPPRGGRLFNGMSWPSGVTISIHTPREGGDVLGAEPVRQLSDAISIHTPREGGDACLPL